MSALHFWVSDRGTRAYPYPGRSTRWSFSSTRKKLINCVQPGVWLVLASPDCPTSRLSRLLLPTLLLPRKATSPKKSPPRDCSGGNCSGRAAERRNSAFNLHYAPERRAVVKGGLKFRGPIGGVAKRSKPYQARVFSGFRRVKLGYSRDVLGLLERVSRSCIPLESGGGGLFGSNFFRPQ